MFYDNDIDVFLDEDEFAKSVSYRAFGVAAASSISGIFDAPGSVVTIGRASMIIEKPQVRVAASAVPDISDGDTMTIDSTVYKVAHWTDDGTGMMTVILAEGKR